MNEYPDNTTYVIGFGIKKYRQQSQTVFRTSDVQKISSDKKISDLYAI
jgi:hypothetical protein